MDMASIDKAGAAEDILTQKIFVGIGTVYVHVTLQAVRFCPDSLVNGLVPWHEVAVETQSSTRLFQKLRVGRAVRVVTVKASLLLHGIIVGCSVLIRKRTLVFGMTGEAFYIYA
jgi:hypothetical protein